MFAYSVSKAGLIGLTLATSHAVACRGILVNAIAPLAATRMALRGLGDEALDERSRTGGWPDVASRGLTPNGWRPSRHTSSRPALEVTGRVFTVGGGTAGLLPIPAPERSVEIDESASQDDVDGTARKRPSARPSSARAGKPRRCPSNDPNFPVADLDA